MASPSPSFQAVCSYARITKCDLEGLGADSLRSCNACGDAGKHHHFCANDERVRSKAADPAGP
eukprot:237013-Pleurochrysis_carterae.AAC.1